MKPNAFVLAAAAGALLAALAGCNESSRQQDASTSRAPQSSQAQREGAAPGPMAANPANEPAAPGTAAPSGPQAPSAGPGAAPDAGATPGASVGAKIDDAAVTAKVKAVLATEAGLAAARVNVTTSAGKVTLKGAVPKDQIERIVQAARSVDGVQDVDNQLRPVAG